MLSVLDPTENLTKILIYNQMPDRHIRMHVLSLVSRIERRLEFKLTPIMNR